MLESLFNKVAGIKKILQRRCFPLKFAKFLRTPILRNTSERLFLFAPRNLCISDSFYTNRKAISKKDTLS